MVPANGFIISQEFAPHGGIAGINAMCGSCPANTRPARIASCAGTLHQHPDSRETEAQLQGIISRFGLAAEIAAAFPATTPLWYGLWAVSPVPVKSLSLLGLLLTEMLAEDRREMELKLELDHRQIENFTGIIEAITRAELHGIPLHVELLPLGHTDFGLYTIFPHCPLCKATARTERWQHRYPAELQACHVCGTRFSPAETSSSSRMKWHDDDELRDKLGPESFRRFFAEHLLACGEPAAEIEGIIEATEAKERQFEEKARQRQEEERRNHEYVQRHVYQDLPRVAPPASQLPESEEDEGSDQELEPAWFGAQEFAEVLRRFEEQGIQVTFLIHRSRDHSKDRFTSSVGTRKGNAQSLFEKWQAAGCNEKFQAGYRVPKELLEKERNKDD